MQKFQKKLMTPSGAACLGCPGTSGWPQNKQHHKTLCSMNSIVWGVYLMHKHQIRNFVFASLQTSLFGALAPQGDLKSDIYKDKRFL